ncbi:50S ribosomal protein L4 [archaeon]|nr:50S ribosomal protein L4 [archaeon]|tara:strand:+ start:7616 stop:8428 length:813 start_codon:yes stop_codon:yes gene_type:complete
MAEKIQVLDANAKKIGETELPVQFSEAIRSDLIGRSVLSLQSRARQAYGSDPKAGMRHSSKLSKRRRKYRGCYGFGISRVNRKIHTRRGTRFFWVGAFSPQTKGGRRAHAPKAAKNFEQKINAKENRKAIRSAMAAGINARLVSERGHVAPSGFPFALDTSFEDLSKTSDLQKALGALGLKDELTRASAKNVRPGRGKSRGRKYKKAKGPLIVVSKTCPLIKSAANVAGVDIVECHAINTELLAPGADAGRLTLWTKAAVEKVAENNLFM